uniref:Uncharacterized protein n=1 Tax=Cacopsylla melanoneura TaxID=428564 RepID=A0A8D9DWE0_9HEMI
MNLLPGSLGLEVPGHHQGPQVQDQDLAAQNPQWVPPLQGPSLEAPVLHLDPLVKGLDQVVLILQLHDQDQVVLILQLYDQDLVLPKVQDHLLDHQVKSQDLEVQNPHLVHQQLQLLHGQDLEVLRIQSLPQGLLGPSLGHQVPHLVQ